MEFRNVSLLLLLLLASLSTVSADQGNDDAYQAGDDAQADDAQGDDAQGDDAQQDDAYQADGDDAAYYDDGSGFSAGDTYIKYWTDYAVLPKRCIV
jgi:hypothetical protein